MNEEVVSVMVHSPKRERRKPGRHAEEERNAKRNGRPSRRWMASEVDKVFDKNTELIKQLQLQRESERILIDAKSKLERELALLRSRKAVDTDENSAFRERNKQLSQDVFLMKNILVKLNFELERYQDKLRKYEDCDTKDDREIGCKTSGGVERRWMEGEATVLAPLLLAYEEALREKDQLIKDLRAGLEKTASDLKAFVKENSSLRAKMADSQAQGEVTYSDWMSVQRQLSVSVEQNQLLTRQAKLAQSKLSDLKSAFQAKLSEVCLERDELSTRLGEVRAELLVLRGKSCVLEQELGRMKSEADHRIPESVHHAYIAECKRLLDELKSRHEEERSSLQKKIAELESDTRQQQKLSSSSSSNRIKELEKDLLESEERREKAERRRDLLRERMGCLVAFSKELIVEHEGLLRGVSGELRHSASLSARISQLKLQLKSVESETLQQIQVLDETISGQVERVRRERQSQDEAVDRLKQELGLKEAHIRALKDAAKKREEDMEIVWKAALTDKLERSPEEIELEIKNS